jgi:hypothetical protein
MFCDMLTYILTRTEMSVWNKQYIGAFRVADGAYGVLFQIISVSVFWLNDVMFLYSVYFIFSMYLSKKRIMPMLSFFSELCIY